MNKHVNHDSLRITEIFHSLQGETATVGLPTVFVRLTGCPLRCTYCDSAYAFYGGLRQTIGSIVTEVENYNTPYVTVTGGEPLAQPGVYTLLKRLLDLSYHVSLETSGAMAIDNVDARTHIVLDLKSPSSGEMSKNLYGNIALLKPSDEVKFVVGNKTDYLWAKDQIESRRLAKQCNVLISPVFEKLPYHQLAEWVLKDNLPARMQIQLHKLIWGDIPGK